ncbi:MAG: ABC transporter ATP-binding protein [Chthonomonadales bacterium]
MTAVESSSEGTMPAELSARLQAKDVSLAYFDGDRTTLAVDRVSLTLPKTGFVGIMGPSGSGKSSLLYLLSGLKRPTSGDVLLDGVPMGILSDAALTTVRRRRFGFVFQQPFLLNYLTARENVLVAALWDDHSAAGRADELLCSLGVEEFAGRFPYHLSGGERQRICVARAMVNLPDVIFADEPTASLDHANGRLVMDLLTSYRTRGVVVVVTHDAEMLTGADRVYHMRDGRLDGSTP